MIQKLKKTLSLLSAMVMTIAAIPTAEIPTFAASTAASKVLYGDVNGDSAIDSTDTTELTKAINNKTASSLKNADLNGDGIVNNSDVVLLKQYVSDEIKYFPVGDYYEEGISFVTRGEWVHNLVTTFDMSVDDASTVTKYYTDLSGNKYENDINLAANFGVFEVNSENFEPDSKVTREFAAHTANFCIGYKNQTQAESYVDYDDIYYVDDAAVAVEKNWFALVENQFCSDMYMKSAESKKIISDVTASLEADKIDENAEQIVKYGSSVIQLDKSVQAAENNETVTISSKNVTLDKGDVFVVYIDGQECLYKAGSVSKGTNGEIIVKTTDLSFEEAFKEIKVQGHGDVDYSKIEYENDAPQTKTYSADTYYLSDYTYLDNGSGTAKDISLNKTVNLGSGISASLTGSLSNIRYDYNLDLQSNTIKSFYLKVNADSNLTAKISGSFSGTKSKEAKIASVPLKVGALSLHASIYATISAKGEIFLSYKCDLGGGVSYTKNGGWRTVKSFHSKGFSIESHASATLAVKAAVEARLAGTKKLAEIFIQAGVKANGNSKNRDDGTICSTVKAYLFAELGTKTILNELFDDPFTNTWQFINEGNSPVKLLKHWENGKLVSTCKYEKISYGSTGSAANLHSRNYGDYTKYGSNFEGLITSDEPVLQDYTINKAMTLEGDLTINGNAIITANVILNGHTLTITGDVIQTGGRMYPGDGTLNVGGNYEISSDGYLYMYSSNGREVNINKDFIMKSNKGCSDSSNYFKSGTLSIGGNFYQYNNGTVTNNFQQEGTKVIFTGNGIHEIHFDSTNSYFTDISSNGNSQFKFTGRMQGFQLNNDMTFVGDTKLDAGTLHLGSHHLTIEGDFTQNGNVNLWNGSLDINGNHIINGYLSNSGELDSIVNVENDVEITSREMNLYKTTMNITGNATQTGGRMYPGGGTLNVGGNYEISSDGYLYMYSSNGGEVNINKDFIMKSNKGCSDSSNYFKSGTLSIGGNFYQYNNGTVTNNFQQEGTKVIFTGNGIHEIHFDSQNSYLNDIAMDNGSSLKFDRKGMTAPIILVTDSEIATANSDTIKAINIGGTQFTVTYSDGSKTTIKLKVNKSDYMEESPKVTTADTTRPVTTSTTTVKTTTTVLPTTTTPNNPLGDINSDNKISVADVALIQRYLVKNVKFTDVQWKQADMNSDGKVNVFDVIILKRKILHS